MIDLGTATTFFYDEDGDSYGVSENTVIAAVHQKVMSNTRRLQ